MAFKETLVDWRSIIKLSSTGLYVANYNEIRNAVTNAFKTIYGDDIDTSTGTADGIYIDMYCLIINNILQAYKTTYCNLNVDQAQGKYLELLCALSNVFRKQATKSTAILTCTLNETTEYKPEEGTSTFSVIDANGLVWTHSKDINNRLVFQPNVPLNVIVECELTGPQSAPAGSITKLVNNEVDMTIVQENAAYLGEYTETDSTLRARRNQSLGAKGTTVLESLIGALLASTCIKDVKLYNNASGDVITAKDGQTIAEHAIYVCLRYSATALSSVDSYASEIGSIIYNKLTPGVLTQECTKCSNGVASVYDNPVTSRITGQTLSSHQYVYWKRCTAVHPQIVVNLIVNSHYTAQTGIQIKTKLCEYLNALSIGENITADDLKFRIPYYDSNYRGISTFIITSVTINGSSSYINADTYYDFTNDNITINITRQ